MNIYEKLTEIQNELKAPKSQKNTFGNYNYRNCEDILEALKPICKKYNSVCFLSNKTVLVGDRFYIEATATIVDCENPTDKIEAVASAREEDVKKGMDASQITGSASSYARKFALAGLFACDDTKDADTQKPRTAREQAEDMGLKLDGVAQYFNTTVEALTDEQILTAIKMKKK